MKRSSILSNSPVTSTFKKPKPEAGRQVLGEISNYNIHGSTTAPITCTENENFDENQKRSFEKVFLNRNHRAYQIFENGGTLAHVKYQSSIENQKSQRLLQRDALASKLSKKERLEDVVVEIKHNLLQDIHALNERNRAADIFVIEFFGIVGSDLVSEAECDVFICGVRRDSSEVMIKEHILKHRIGGNFGAQVNPVVEYIPPSLDGPVDELYLYIEAKLKNVEMSRRRRVIKGTSTEGSNEFFVGAVQISSKTKEKDSRTASWLKSYRKGGIAFVKEPVVEIGSKHIVDIVKRGRKNQASGTSSFTYELSNDHGYGGFDEEEQMAEPRKRGRPRKSFITAASPSKEGKIVFDFQKVDWTAAPASLKNAVLHSLSSKAIDLIINESIHTAHEKGNRKFTCVFCQKTFSSYPNLKFHLAHAYPSLSFEFTPEKITVSFDEKEYARSMEKLEKRTTKMLFKPDVYSKGSSAQLLPSEASTQNFPYVLTTSYATVPASNRGLFRCDIPIDMMKQSISQRLDELIDVEPHEKAFYYLWNCFNAKISNRPGGVMALYSKLTVFLEECYDDLRAQNLMNVWTFFLLYFKNVGQITEREFFTLSFYKTSFDGKFVGGKAPVQL